MFILPLSVPDWIAYINMLSAISPNVLLSPLVLFTKLIPSIMHADGDGMLSADDNLPLVCFASVDLFAFLRMPSQLNSAQGSGPKECCKTSHISRL